MHSTMQHWRASHQRPLQQTRQQPANSSRTARPQHSSKCCCLPSAARQDLYLVLGVPYDVDSDAIKAAFRAQAKLLHPDVNKAADAEAAFRLLKRAHEVLSDTMLRVAHDSELRESLGEASAALRARDPRFARFERWRREIRGDLEMLLEAWTAEVMGLLDDAEAALSRQEQEFRWAMVQAAPPASAAASLDWQTGGSSSSNGGSSDQQQMQCIVDRMRGTLNDAAANVQRLYDKRYEQMQTRFPAYPDIVWYDQWLEVSDGWLDASERLLRRWTPRIAGAAQWLPNSQVPVSH